MYGYGHEYRHVYVYKYGSNVSKHRQAYCKLERILIMRRNNLLKAGVLTLVLTLAIGMTACGKKNNSVKDNDTTVTQENVTTADKNNTKKSSKVVFDYTDADGVTTKLEGNATVSDNGEATIEVVDSNGNKAVFTGKASTDNGKLSVSDIEVKDASTLVKTDGTEVKVSEDAKIEDATESTEATKADVAAKEEPKEDTIIADGSDSNVSEGNENAGDNGADNGNVSDTPSNEPVETPDVPNTPSEPEYNEPEYVPDEPDNSNDSNNEDAGSSGTGNKFYDDFMNGGHMEGDEDLIDKDSDPSKPCPYPLNTPIEGTYTGVNGDGVYGTYPVYIVYTLCSEDATGGMAAEIVQNMYYGGEMFYNGELILPYVSLPIGEYDCGVVRASYVPRV